jgi:carboxypeptidase-like protein
MKQMALLFTLLAPLAGVCQGTVFGKIRARDPSELLTGVTVSNPMLGVHNISDMGGNFRIRARPGDTLVFSIVGYRTDTLVVSGSMFTGDLAVYLEVKAVTLPTVKITESNYQQDSIERRQEYSWLLDKKHPVKLWNEKREGDDPGLSFSPIGYFSKTEVRKRRLKKRLREEERDYYIDSKFPRGRVTLLTGLKGDSLQLFMIRYRPSYEFCRRANTMDMLLYINDKLALFKRGR